MLKNHELKKRILETFLEWSWDKNHTPYIQAAGTESELSTVLDLAKPYPESNPPLLTITLDLNAQAVSKLTCAEDGIEFNARFGGISRKVFVPYNSIIYVFTQDVPMTSSEFESLQWQYVYTSAENKDDNEPTELVDDSADKKQGFLKLVK